MNRRQLLTSACAGGTLVIAGCSSDSDTQEPGGDEPESGNNTNGSSESEESDEELEEPAEFRVLDVRPQSNRIDSTETEVSATIQNSGRQTATQEVKLLFEDEVQYTAEITLEPDEETEVSTTVGNLDLNYTEYSYTFRTDNSTLGDTFKTYTPPVEEPDSVPEYTVKNRDDVSYEDAKRLDFDIVSYVESEERHLVDLSTEDLLDICRDKIREVLQSSDYHAISFNFWRVSQTIGGEQAQAVVDWAPNSTWSESESVPAGEYSAHEFSVMGLAYVQVMEIDGSEVVEANESFTIEWVLRNRGFDETDFSGFIENTDGDVLNNFTVNLDVGEEKTVSITDELSGFDYGDMYSMSGTSRQIHGVTFLSVEVE